MFWDLMFIYQLAIRIRKGHMASKRLTIRQQRILITRIVQRVEIVEVHLILQSKSQWMIMRSAISKLQRLTRMKENQVNQTLQIKKKIKRKVLKVNKVWTKRVSHQRFWEVKMSSKIKNPSNVQNKSKLPS